MWDEEESQGLEDPGLYARAEKMNPEATLIGEDEKGHVDAVPVYMVKPKKRDYKARWVVMWTEEAEGTGLSILEQAANKELNATDFRVRDYIMCKAGIGNFVHISQSDASKWLGIAQPHISTSIKKLIRLGIVLPGPSAGKFKSYQINPAFVYVGNLGDGVRKRKDAINERGAMLQ